MSAILQNLKAVGNICCEPILLSAIGAQKAYF